MLQGWRSLRVWTRTTNAAEVSAATVLEDKEVQHQMDRKDGLEGDYKE